MFSAPMIAEGLASAARAQVGGEHPRTSPAQRVAAQFQNCTLPLSALAQTGAGD